MSVTLIVTVVGVAWFAKQSARRKALQASSEYLQNMIANNEYQLGIRAAPADGYSVAVANNEQAREFVSLLLENHKIALKQLHKQSESSLQNEPILFFAAVTGGDDEGNELTVGLMWLEYAAPSDSRVRGIFIVQPDGRRSDFSDCVTVDSEAGEPVTMLRSATIHLPNSMNVLNEADNSENALQLGLILDSGEITSPNNLPITR